MLKIQRFLETKIKEKMFLGKVIVLFGPRRAGKTTLAKKIANEYGEGSYYLNCENLQEREYLQLGQPEIFKRYIQDKKLIILDEAQSVPDIGKILKVIVDAYPELQIIATGSSSFDLANKYVFFLSPFSYKEIGDKDLETQLIFGNFPQVVSEINKDNKIVSLGEITTNYLYKDIFTFENIKKPKLLDNLLKTLAFQVGQEVNKFELAKHLKTSPQTIERYLNLLEKTYVIKILYSLVRNRRDEINTNFKVYFLDLGIRNYIINNFNILGLRDDVGRLFENFFFIERLKKHWNEKQYLPLIYFWRTHRQLEIDYIEEKDGKFYAFECKWGDKVPKFTQFQESYPNSETFVVNRQNFEDFI